MIFLKRRLSDEEYVQRVRKFVRFVRWFQWLWPILLMGMFVCMISLATLSNRLRVDFPEHQGAIITGLLLGGLFGFMFALVAAQTGLCIQQWWRARYGYRTERLMLKYHDELKNCESALREDKC